MLSKKARLSPEDTTKFSPHVATRHSVFEPEKAIDEAALQRATLKTRKRLIPAAKSTQTS